MVVSSSAALQEHGRAILERPARPVLLRGRGGVDRLLHELRRRLVPGAEHVRVIVRHHHRRGLAGADLLAADHNRNVDVFGRLGNELAFSEARSGVPGA